MKRILSLAAVLVLSLARVSAQDRVMFVAGGVTCSMCSYAIHDALARDSAVKRVGADLENQVWYVEYRKDGFRVDRLKKGVEDAGFSLEKAWLNGSLVYEKKRKVKKK